MAKELLLSTTTGKSVYAIIRVPTGSNIGKWANPVDERLDDYNAVDYQKYAVTMNELGALGLYEGDIPFVVAKSVRIMEVIYLEQAGVSPAESDTKLSASLYEFGDHWVATTSLSV